VRLIPETTDIEGADAPLAAAGNTSCRKCLCRLGLPGSSAHIEFPGTTTEQERPRGNLRLVAVGAAMQGKTEVLQCQRFLGVGPFHSSDEAREGDSGRVGGAKGKAEQGTRRRER